MSDSIILRVHSKAGRSRVEISSKASCFDLRQELEKRLNIPAKQIKLFSDQGMTKELKVRDSDSLTKAGLKNGDMLHIGNQTVELSSVKDKLAAIEKKKADDEKQAKIDEEEKKKKEEKKIEQQYKDEYVPKTKNIYGANVKTLDNVEKTSGQFKHESFDNYLKEMVNKSKKQNSTMIEPKNISYLPNLKETSGLRRRPPAVILNRQVYRHVDYVSFQNHRELAKFVGFW